MVKVTDTKLKYCIKQMNGTCEVLPTAESGLGVFKTAPNLYLPYPQPKTDLILTIKGSTQAGEYQNSKYVCILALFYKLRSVKSAKTCRSG